MKMKKIIAMCLCLLLVLSLTSVFTGCQANEAHSGDRTVVDMRGETINLPEKVERYCVIYSSAVPMLAMLDKNLEHAVMYPKSSYYEYWEFEILEGVEEHAVRVNKREVTAEQIIESGAQVLFWNKASHEELVKSLSAVGIACVNIQVNNAEDLMKALNIMAETLGTDYANEQVEKYKNKFAEYEEYVTQQVSTIPESEKKDILVLGNVDSLVGYGPNTYTAYWTQIAGLNHILPSNDGADEVNLTMEQIYEFDPDIILANGIFDVEDVYASSTWSVLGATKNNMLLSNPSVLDMWSMPTCEAPLQFIWALNKFYPEYAGDMNLIDETIAFYKEFYGYEMSREDAESILASDHRMLTQ